ncbi:MAG TPA: hypothetical protein VHV83_22105 [Armatimonadota bacterium]|nr:hypothetical protein [Armatimonadota bacterium]
MRKFVVLLILLLTLPALAGKVRTTVSAYHSHRRTATGGYPHKGTCAGPKSWLGCYVHVPGMGVFKVTDTCRRGIDIWLPSRKACKRWGRRVLTVRVSHPKPKHHKKRR